MYVPHILQGGGAGRPSQEEQEEKARQMTEMKNSILSQVLDQQARARRRGLCACLSKTL